MKKLSAEDVIAHLGLIPLSEEGGLHRQTYVSEVRTESGEAAGTAIFYLLRGNAFSHLHRLTGDELYHFYLGDPVELVELLPDGRMKKTVLGSDLMAGQEIQHLVPAGNWQGSHLAEGGEWALLGTTMCPGYTDACYEHGRAEELLAAYPGAGQEILSLTGAVRS